MGKEFIHSWRDVRFDNSTMTLSIKTGADSVRFAIRPEVDS